MRDELEADGRVNGNITSNAESVEGSNNKEGAIRVTASKTETERSADQTGEVECPLTSCRYVRSDRDIYNASLGSGARVPTNNVDQESPHKSSSSEASGESDLACGLEVCCSSDGWNEGAHRNVTTLITCVDTSQLWILYEQNSCDLPGNQAPAAAGPESDRRLAPK